MIKDNSLTIIEYYRKNNLISIEIVIMQYGKFKDYIDFNIYGESVDSMKAKAYDYIIKKINNGYTIQDIEKLDYVFRKWLTKDLKHD